MNPSRARKRRIAVITMALALTSITFAAMAGEMPTSRDVGDRPIPVEADGGIGDTPMPVEPDSGIGDIPMPVEPDDGIGDTPS